jgi:endonuclease III
LLSALLFSTRISAGQAEKAAKALFDRGWRTPKAMCATTWSQRVKVLNRSGYARYDESTSRYIADTTSLLMERYGGDLRKLREAAGHDPKQERRLLKEFKGIGDVGADIFFREAQVVWNEHYPFADRRALRLAGKLGLGSSARDLARLVDSRDDLPRLLSALVVADLEDEADEVLQAAA